MTYSYAVFAMYGARSARAIAPQAMSGRGVVRPQTVPPTGSFTGTVTDSHGSPLHGVSVSIIPAGPMVEPADGDGGFGVFTSDFDPSFQVLTAADGTFAIAHVPTGSFGVCYTASTFIVTGGDNDALGYQDYCPQDDVARTLTGRRSRWAPPS